MIYSRVVCDRQIAHIGIHSIYRVYNIWCIYMSGLKKINPKHLAIEKKTTAKCIDRYYNENKKKVILLKYPLQIDLKCTIANQQCIIDYIIGF